MSESPEPTIAPPAGSGDGSPSPAAAGATSPTAAAGAGATDGAAGATAGAGGGASEAAAGAATGAPSGAADVGAVLAPPSSPGVRFRPEASVGGGGGEPEVKLPPPAPSSGLAFTGEMFFDPEALGDEDGPQLEVIRSRSKRRLSVATEAFLKHRVKATDALPAAPPEGSTDDEEPTRKLLNQAMATGICGNNITSSCLYVIALCAGPAGKYAPGALLFICGLLYLFRRIYTEVVAALPVNGGTYNLLLNTTSKGKASAAACLTMLSYVATAVISSTSAMRYVHSLAPEFSVVVATLGVLLLVAILNLAGITESAGVALSIFIFHLTTLAVLILAATYTAVFDMPSVADGSSVLVDNWANTEPDGGAVNGIFFGFSAALLGISGFESSANYVEEQQPGVFPKTLRNMWVAVTVINPTLAFLAQCLMPVADIAAQGESGALLSNMGAISAGRWLEVLVIIDAALVLTGAVVSSFVGFTGLVYRMTMDRCLPQVLLATNAWRGTRHWIIIGFFTLTSLMVLFTNGNVEVLAGVYTIAFLSVMALFTVGNMLLKVRRSQLPTPVHASWKWVLFAFCMVVAGLFGNIVSRDSLALQGFVMFGAVFVLPVFIMLNRAQLLRMVVGATATWADRYDPRAQPVGCWARAHQSFYRFIKFRVRNRLQEKIQGLTQKPLVFFTNDDAPETLTKAITYILANEQRRWIKFVRVFDKAEDVPLRVSSTYEQLAKMFPELRLDYVATVGVFGPAMVRSLSRELHVPATFMFMATFSDKFPYSFTQLGGLRLITN